MDYLNFVWLLFRMTCTISLKYCSWKEHLKVLTSENPFPHSYNNRKREVNWSQNGMCHAMWETTQSRNHALTLKSFVSELRQWHFPRSFFAECGRMRSERAFCGPGLGFGAPPSARKKKRRGTTKNAELVTAMNCDFRTEQFWLCDQTETDRRTEPTERSRKIALLREM
jgi:hypothetical protein